MNKLEIITLKKQGIRNFADERNLLLKKAKSEWVLFIDSDEKPEDGLTSEIEEVINDPKNKFNGFIVRRKIYFLGKYIGTDKVLRLAKRNTGKWHRAVHETWNVKKPVGLLKGYLIHNTYGSVSQAIDKINKYSTTHALENIKEGKRTNILKIILFPTFKFIENLLNGRGFVFSMLQSFHSFLGWAKMLQIQNKT